MLKKYLKTSIICALISFLGVNAQVGIGNIAPTSTLDITATNPTGATTNVDGILIPRVDRQRAGAMLAIPNGTMVFVNSIATGAATGINSNITATGFYFFDTSVLPAPGKWVASGSDKNWSTSGNTGTNGGNTTTAGTNFVGTTDSQNLDFRTNGVVRSRISAAGEVFVGTLNTTIVGDLFNVVSNATFPFAVNGYSANTGSGVYGSVTAGATVFGAVQGEYVGTAATGTGVRGATYSTSSGTNFTSSVSSGVQGTFVVPSARNYAFGVFGTVGNNTYLASTRSGGVLGTDLFASGALGYYAANGNDYSVYGFNVNYQNGVATGKNKSNINTQIGLGINGGPIGGWIKGTEYGTILAGKRFANYNIGKTISNEAYIVLDKKIDGTKVVSYTNTSMTIDIQDKGVGKLENGISRVNFNKDYADLINENKPIVVTVTPIGECNGVYILDTDKKGFSVKENQKGSSNVAFNWIVIAEKNNERSEISKEILSANFENNLLEVMHDENTEGGKAIWSEDGEIKFGKNAPFQESKRKIAVENEKLGRVKLVK